MLQKKRLKTNIRPVNLLRSWLRHQDIPFSEGLAPPTDLVVGTPPDRACVHVTLGPWDTGPRLDPPGVNLDGECLCYGTQERVIEAWWSLLSAVGIQEPLLPFERGTFFEDREGRRVSADKDGDELIFLRHNAFERSPNPSPAQVSCYENTVGIVTKLYWRRNRRALQALGCEFDEVLTYAWVWTVSYIANYEVRPPEGQDNQRLLFAFLRQGFRRLWDKRHRLQYLRLRTAPEDLREAVGMQPVSVCRQRGRGGGAGLLFPEVSPLGIPMELELPAGEAAALCLEERLWTGLPHNEAVRRLQAAARAVSALEKDVRLLARQNLVEHLLDCEKCKSQGVKIETWRRGLDRGTGAGGARAQRA